LVETEADRVWVPNIIPDSLNSDRRIFVKGIEPIPPSPEDPGAFSDRGALDKTFGAAARARVNVGGW